MRSRADGEEEISGWERPQVRKGLSDQGTKERAGWLQGGVRTQTGLGEFRRKVGPGFGVIPKDALGFKEGTCVV